MRNFLFSIIPSPHSFDVPFEWCVYYNIGMSKFAMKILGKNSRGVVHCNVPLWCLRLKDYSKNSLGFNAYGHL
jgi:hypothetical protein